MVMKLVIVSFKEDIDVAWCSYEEWHVETVVDEVEFRNNPKGLPDCI